MFYEKNGETCFELQIDILVCRASFVGDPSHRMHVQTEESLEMEQKLKKYFIQCQDRCSKWRVNQQSAGEHINWRATAAAPVTWGWQRTRTAVEQSSLHGCQPCNKNAIILLARRQEDNHDLAWNYDRRNSNSRFMYLLLPILLTHGVEGAITGVVLQFL
jgi:hypothetical protein